MDWIYLDTSQTDREDLELNMEKVLNHTAVTGAYSPACARILNEYICVSNFPTCDLSHPSPRPVMVRLGGGVSFRGLARGAPVGITVEPLYI